MRTEGRVVDTDEGLTMAVRAQALYQFVLEVEENPNPYPNPKPKPKP